MSDKTKKISVSRLVQDQILEGARRFLKKLVIEAETNSVKTKLQKDLDEFFAKGYFSKYGGNLQAELAEFTKIITGYQPVSAGVIPQQFQCFVRKNVPRPNWIGLKNASGGILGFGSLELGFFQFNVSYDRPATVEESEKFLEVLEKIDADKLFNWITSNIGADAVLKF